MQRVAAMPAAREAASVMIRAGFINAARAFEVYQRRGWRTLPANAFEDFEDWFTSMLDGEVAP